MVYRPGCNENTVHKMKIIDNGFMIVRGKQPFIDWANEQEDEFVMDASTEPNVYLIEDDFFEIEPVVKKHFKKVFLNELSAIDENKDAYPEITLENFEAWFSVELGTTVFDTEK